MLDVKDTKLLSTLATNARQTHNQLAKKTGLSKSAVGYRIQRLQDKHIITSFTCYVNLPSLQLTTCMLLLDFSVDVMEKKGIKRYFRTHPYCRWAAVLSGRWAMAVEFVVRDVSHMRSVVQEMTAHFGKELNKYSFFHSEQVLQSYRLPGAFQTENSQNSASTPVSVDAIDTSLLHTLAKNSSLSFVAIAQKLNTTIDVVRYRMKQLQQKHVIEKFTPAVDLAKIGYTEYLYHITLRSIDLEKIEQIKKQIIQYTPITHAYIDMLSLQIFFICAFEDPSEIDAVTRYMRRNHYNTIEDHEYFIIKEHFCFCPFPKGCVT